MTIHRDDLEQFNGPRYQALAELLGDRIKTNQLKPGSRLPPQREMAHRLSVTVGTIGRAYDLLIQRGLARGEVGRGTYVLDRTGPPDSGAAPRNTTGGLLDLAVNRPVHTEAMNELSSYLRDPGLQLDLGAYPPCIGTIRQRTAAGRWLSTQGLDVTPDQIMFTNGAQGALASAILGLTRSGDTILAEALTYTGIRNLSRTLERRLEPVAMDASGIVPDALAAACRRHRPRLLVTTPTVQNPTCVQMPIERRLEIVEIARANDLLILEDEVYAPLSELRPKPFSMLAPERSMYVISLSKFLAPALRFGILAAPNQHLRALVTASDHLTIAIAPMSPELFVRAEQNGLLERAVSLQRQAVRKRHDLACSIMPSSTGSTPVHGLHLWHQLGPGQDAESATLQLAAAGIRVIPSERFAVVRRDMPEAIRISLGPPADLSALRVALTTIARTLESARIEHERFI